MDIIVLPVSAVYPTLIMIKRTKVVKTFILPSRINLSTLLGIITTGSLKTGKNIVREHGEIAQNPPHLSGRYFTGVQTTLEILIRMQIFQLEMRKFGNFCIVHT